MTQQSTEDTFRALSLLAQRQGNNKLNISLLARICGVHHEQIRRIENGESEITKAMRENAKDYIKQQLLLFNRVLKTL